LLVNYSEIYWQNISLLFPLVYTNKKFTLVFTKGITVWNDVIKKEEKWCVIIIDGITKEICLSIILVNGSIDNIEVITWQTNPPSPLPHSFFFFFLFLLLLLYYSIENNIQHPYISSQIKLPSSQIWLPQHSVCQHPCSSSILFWRFTTSNKNYPFFLVTHFLNVNFFRHFNVVNIVCLLVL